MCTGGVAFGATFNATVKSPLPSSGMFAASAAASASPNTLSKNGGGLFGGGIASPAPSGKEVGNVTRAKTDDTIQEFRDRLKAD